MGKSFKTIALLCIMHLAAVADAEAQTLRVWKDGSYTSYKVAELSDMAFSMGGKKLVIGNTPYLVQSEIDSITVAVADTHEGRVVVTYSDATATVDVPASVSGVTYTVNGADVVITSTNVTDEIEYVLQGESSNGSLLYNGEYKCGFYLNDLNLTSTTTAPIDIECGKRINFVLQEGTVNTLCDAAGGTHKAALYTKGHLEIAGPGTLNVTGKTRHAIGTKEYCQIKRSTGTVNILGAASDGIHAGQYFQMNGGTLAIKDNKGDAIQAEATNDATDEFNGQIFIKGGKITASATGDDTKAIKADTDITISGGTLNLTASGDGSRGIQTSGNLLINEDDATTIIGITANGDKYTDPNPPYDESRCWGIKVKGNIVRTAGTVSIKATKPAKAAKADGEMVGMDEYKE